MSVLEPNHYWDGIMNGVDPGEEEFTNILDILDFPEESLEEDNGLGEDLDPSNYQSLGPIPVDTLSGISPGFSMGSGNANRVPCYNAPVNIGSGQQELPEYVADDTSTVTLCQTLISPESSAFQMPSPVSVLESSCSSGKSLSLLADRPVRARSKRARKSTVNPWLLTSPITYASVLRKRSNTGKDKDKKKRKVSQLPNALEATENFSLQAKKKLQVQVDVMEKKETNLRRSVVTKKCTHCEVTKTPQWREGPLGPKTLCNACGVRFRSGRLFPEYRPAASPTFVPSLHSNSHKKVIAMRKNAMQEAAATGDDPPMSPLLEFIPTSSHMLEYLF